jgi:ribosomal protein S18 acetylase RimI-like enzyme
MDQMTVLVVGGGEGDIVGTVAYEVTCHGEGHLRGMAVDPRAQGGGVATALIQAVEQELASLGCERVTLDTTQALQRAIRFYERHGYRATGVVGDFFGMPLFEYAKHIG